MEPKQIVERFWQTMNGNDFYKVGEWLHDEYILEWKQSGERIRGRENFARLNTAYPAAGLWSFTINSIIAEGNLVVTDVSVTDGARNDRVITFTTVKDGKIWRQVEFWPEPFEAPEWRSPWVEKIDPLRE
jgi:ketosteroid isomerase-like protein